MLAKFSETGHQISAERQKLLVVGVRIRKPVGTQQEVSPHRAVEYSRPEMQMCLGIDHRLGLTRDPTIDVGGHDHPFTRRSIGIRHPDHIAITKMSDVRLRAEDGRDDQRRAIPLHFVDTRRRAGGAGGEIFLNELSPPPPDSHGEVALERPTPCCKSVVSRPSMEHVVNFLHSGCHSEQSSRFAAIVAGIAMPIGYGPNEKRTPGEKPCLRKHRILARRAT